jgi:hypothetical protein
MTELLQKLGSGSTLTLDVNGFLVCLGLALVASLVAELMYAVFYENRGTGSQIHRSFILIGPSVTLLFICVQLSLPLSLGLLGALSIVRFRTPIKEPEEIGFLMLLIAASIGIATFNFMFVLYLYLAVAIALTARKLVGGRVSFLGKRDGMLLVNLSESVYQAQADELGRRLDRCAAGLRLESLSSSEGTVSLHYRFASLDVKAWPTAQAELFKVIPYNKISVFFNDSVTAS